MAVAEALLVLPVKGTVSGVEVADDLVGGLRVGMGELFLPDLRFVRL